MTRPRLWAIPGLVGVALLLVFPVGPAAATSGAAAGLSVTISAPGDGQRFSSTDAVTVSGQVNASALLASVDTVTVRIYYGDSEVYGAQACGPCSTESTISFSHTSPSLGRNGPYGVEVVANGHVLLSGLAADGHASRSFVLAVPAGPPTAITPTVLDDRSVKLTWTAPAPVPGLLGYAVYRKVGADGFEPLGLTKSTTFTDTNTSRIAGAIQYQVASIREGGVPGDPATALQTPAPAVVATLPPLPSTTTVPGATTTSLPPGGGTQENGAASLDIGSLLPSNSSQGIQFPSTSTPPTLPVRDTGFNPTLPFTSTTVAPTKVEGRQQGRTAAATGHGEVASGGSSDNANRRALLVPVAAGSVLCVTALHLRWLNRRVAMSTGLTGAGGGVGGGDAFGPSDLEHLPFDTHADAGAFRPRAQPVGAGTGGSTGRPRAGAGAGSAGSRLR